MEYPPSYHRHRHRHRPAALQEYTFAYPKSWVRRKNQLRSGIYIANYQTADKLSVESFPLEEAGAGAGGGGEALARAAVAKILNPTFEIGGDSRIEMPPIARIKWEDQDIDGTVRERVQLLCESLIH